MMIIEGWRLIQADYRMVALIQADYRRMGADSG